MHSLTFGAINLIGTAAELSASGYNFQALSDDTSWGNPVSIEEKVISWLQDGALLSLAGYDNRDDMVVRIKVVGTDSNKLALGERALMLETGKPNTLTWTPPDGAGAPCVFDVVMSSLSHSMDDLGELRQPLRERIYTLRLKCLPFARSQAQVSVTVPAPTGTQAITLIDNCSSATNWTKTIQVGAGAPATTAAAVTGGTAIIGQTSFLSQTESTRLSLTRSSLSASMTTTPYLRVDMSTYGTGMNWASGTRDVSFKLNGLAAPIASQTGSIYWFDASALAITTLTTFEVSGYVIGAGSTGNFTITVADLSRSNVLGDQGTGRQLLRTIPVAGSARTQGDLAIADTTNALGSVLVYTYPQAAGVASPNLRAWYASGAGAITADATTVYGSTMAIGGFTPYFDIPASAIQPGGHIVLARLKRPTTGTSTIQVTVSGRQGSSFVGPSTVGQTIAVPLVANTWKIATVGTLNLPFVQVGSSGKVRISIEEPAAAGVVLDEAWLFNIETGRLTWVECGTAAPSAGGSSNRLWLDAATLANPTPDAFVGFASDRSDSYFPGRVDGLPGTAYSLPSHNFVPTVTNVFTVTTNSTASSITLSHYPRWHTHVAA